MKAVLKQIGALLLFVSGALGQVSSLDATLQKIEVFQEAAGVRVEMTLSAPVTPTVNTAIHPDRLFLEFPNTVLGPMTQRIPVQYKGVRLLRAGLHRASPAITRVVLELDQAQTYHLSSDQNRVTLVVSPDVKAAVSTRGAPAAAASGGLIGVFRRKQKNLEPVAQADSPAAVPPPPSFPPIKFPQGQTTASTATSTSSDSQPTAAHPARSSLQQGTVFPELGLPGSGRVPAAEGSER
jgi:hypothetical protein